MEVWLRDKENTAELYCSVRLGCECSNSYVDTLRFLVCVRIIA